MPIVRPDSVPPWADVLRTWNELDVPEGWRPEITREGPVLAPPPGGAHNLVADAIHHALVVCVDHRRFGVFQWLGVAVPLIGEIFMPDLCVVERKLVPRSPERVMAENVVLAVEIASAGNPDHDRKHKKAAYARGGIAQFLLVDPFDPEGPAVFVFSWPEDGIYRKMVRKVLGEKMGLSDPVP